MKKKNRVQCPCGYVIDFSRSLKEVFIQVRTHFENFHKDLLPFGITNGEIMNLLIMDSMKRKPRKSTENISNSNEIYLSQ